MTHKFQEYKIDDLTKAVTNLIKRHKTIASATQAVLMGIAFDIEANQSAKELTNFVVSLSDVNAKGKLNLSSTARAVGAYMGKILPVEWEPKEKAFICTEGEFDFEAALKVMQETRWDTYDKKDPDKEFKADMNIQRAIALIKGVIAHHDKGDLQDDDPAYLQARKFAKAF